LYKWGIMNESFQEQIEKKSENELIEIISNDSKWQKEYVDIAELEAKKRNISINDILHNRELYNEMIQDEYQNGINVNLNFFDYLNFMELYEYSYSKVLWKNKSYFKYYSKTRRHAKSVLFIHVLIFFVVFYFRFLKDV